MSGGGGEGRKRVDDITQFHYLLFSPSFVLRIVGQVPTEHIEAFVCVKDYLISKIRPKTDDEFVCGNAGIKSINSYGM